MQKVKKKGVLCLFIMCIIFVMIPLNTALATNETFVIEATDGAELFDLVQEAVNNGKTKIQVNVSGTLNFETFASHDGDRLVKLKGIEELVIVGTTEKAKFVQTGIGVNDMSVDGGKLTFKNITIEDTTVYQYENGESAWEFCYAEYGGIVEFNNCVIRGEYGGIMTNGTAKFTNCKFISEKDSSHGGNEYAVWVNNGSAIFTNCTFTGKRGIKTHEQYGSEVTSIVIDSCIFSNLTQKPGVAIGSMNKETVITIKNSAFYGCQPGDNKLYIYESDTEISAFTMKLENNVVCNNHKLEKVDSVDATCTEDGNIAYWTCNDCKNKYSDESGKNIITDVTIDAVGHNLEHHEAKTMIPCKEDGCKEYWYCKICKKYFTDEKCTKETLYEDLFIDCGEHKFKDVAEVPASYTAAGTKAHVVCSDCGEIRLTKNGKAVKKSELVIPQLVKVEEGKAEVTQDAVSDAIKDANTTNTVTLPLQNTGKDVTSAKIPVVSIKDVASANKALTIETSKIIATFDNTALKAIVSKAGSNDTVTIEIIEKTKDTLKDEQKKAIANEEVVSVISAEILCGNQKVHDFEGGKVTVKIPFTPIEGTQGSDYKVLYVADNGTIEEIDTNYVNGYLVVNLEHFSEYIIAKVSTQETNLNSDIPQTGDNIIVWISTLFISMIGLISIVAYSKNK